MIGKTISHYKILEELGRGGMGVVYKAEDSKLKRDVALKFLPPELTRDPEAKERFVREAQAASALDHPYIGTIHEIDETEDGQLFIAMACYEGETLKHKIESGPLKIKDCIELATQVAEGLTNAHKQGIIHRDIKPANVMVTGDNRVKILDFGLAKLQGQSQFTKAGTTLGTVAYMSPEQLRGEKVDHRTDIWSLGVLIYEMVTGRLPFTGIYEQAALYSIQNEEPEPMTALRTGVPLALEGIVVKAMSKEPAERYQHVEEMPVDLRAVDSGSISASTAMKKITATSSISRPKRWQRLLPWSIAGLMVVIVALFAVRGVIRPTPEAPSSLMRFVINLPSDQRLVGPASVAISPDGTRLVYAAAQTGDEPQLFLRTLEQFEASPIAGTEGGDSPFFSPDGQWVGFFAEGAFMKVPVTGGVPLKICDAPSLAINFAATWDGNDDIIFPVGHASGLARVSVTGGTPERLTNPDFDRGEVGHWVPHMLPNGKGLLFTVWTFEGGRVALHSFETGERRLILGEMAVTAQYIPTGHLVIMQSGGLLAVPFDLERLETTGAPIPLPERVSPSLTEMAFSISNNGTLVYLPFNPAENTLMWVDREGRAVPVMKEQGRYRHPRLSPDGKKIALTVTSMGTGQEIEVYDLERHTRSRLTVDGSVNNYAVWTPDGVRITFNSTRAEQGLYWKLADGSGKAEKLLPRSYPQHPCDWSPDGKTLVYTEMNPTTGKDVWALSFDNKRTATPLIATSFQEHSPEFSPDGRWLTYVSDETGHDEVYVVRYPDLSEKWLISTEGGNEPVWSADGQELFYRNQDKMMSVSIQTEPLFRAGKPQRLFEGQWAASAISTPHYDVSSDRQRFIMIRSDKGSTPRQLHVVVNWFEEIKRHTSGAK